VWRAASSVMLVRTSGIFFREGAVDVRDKLGWRYFSPMVDVVIIS